MLITLLNLCVTAQLRQISKIQIKSDLFLYKLIGKFVVKRKVKE